MTYDPIHVAELENVIASIERAIQLRAKEIGELATLLGRKYGELHKAKAEKEKKTDG